MPGTAVLSSDFNGSTFGPGWLTTQPVIYTNPCGPSLDGTPSAWMGSTVASRTLVTNSFDLSCGAEVCFDFDFANDDPCGGCSNCDSPDLQFEGVYFSYSIDGGVTWVDIYYFESNNTGSGQNFQWNNHCFILPPAAWTAATMFRWDQPMISSQNNDHWGIDNVSVTPADCNFYYDWAHVPGFPDDPIQYVTPGDTTTYYVTYTDGVTSCTDSVVVNVLPLEIDIVGTPNPIDCGSCADLSVDFLSGSNGSIVDDFDSGINPAMWGDIQSGTASTICGGGATGNALYFDGTGASRYAETVPVDATSCGNIDFCLYMGNTVSGGSPCENNESGENIQLEYSIDNGVTFVPIATYLQSLWDGANYQQCFSEVMPAAAQTATTIFRWRQVAFSAFVGSDNWSLDEVVVSCNLPTITYNWSTGMVNDATSPTPIGCPTSDELYTVSVVNSANGCNATDTTTLFVNPCVCSFIQFDGAVTFQPGGIVDLNGFFEYSYSPTTGTIEVEATNGTGTYSQTFNLPFTDSLLYTYSITGIPNDGSNITLEIYFSDSVSCTQTFDLLSPLSCFFTEFDASLVYLPSGMIDVTGTFAYLSNPTTGTLEIVATNGTGTYSQTFNPPFTDSIINNFLLTGITNDGSTITFDIYFTDSLSCSATFSVTPTVSIEVIDGQNGSCIVAPNPVNEESQLIFNNENQAEVTISIVNERGQLVFETTTKEQSISINGNQFKQGIYFFNIKSDDTDKVCSGKFAVTH